MNKASNYSCGSELKVNRFLNSIAVICSVAYSSFAISQANWDFNGTDHGWDTSNYSRIKAGEFYATHTIGRSPNPNLGTTSARIDAESSGYVVMRIMNQTINTRVQVILNRNNITPNTFTSYDGLSTNDTEFQTYYIDMGRNKNWSGTVDDITFRFRKNRTEGAVSGTILIDNISVANSESSVKEASAEAPEVRNQNLPIDGNVPEALRRFTSTDPTQSVDAYVAPKVSNEPLNFIHIIMDDLRTEGLSAYGDSAIVTPNIDRLAREGVTFDRAYANFPSCGASRASMLTGLRPAQKRFVRYDARIDKDAPGVTTLPHLLKDNGYLTLSFGKIIHARGDTDDAWSVPPWDAKYSSENKTSYMNYNKKENIESFLSSCKKKKICSPAGGGRGPRYEWADVPDTAYNDGKTAVAAITALEELSEAKMPFYLAVGFVKPHLPFNAPTKYWDLYDRDKIEMSPMPDKPRDAPDQAWHKSGELREWYSGDGIPDTATRWIDNVPSDTSRILRHGYYASTSYADAQMGKVLDAIDRLGLSDNTVVIFTGDHGFSLGDHTMWNKHSLFTLTTQSPLIIRKPGGEAGKNVEGVVEYLDIYPTVTDLAGLSGPKHLEGESLAKTLDNVSAQTKSAIFTRYHAGENIHTDRYSYSAWFNGERITEHMLYDHEKDPLETVNEANNPEYRVVMTDLQKQLKAHIKQREARAARL